MLLSLLFCSALSNAVLPPDAQALLERFPDKALSLPIVIGRAMGASDSYRVVESSRESIESATLSADSALDTVLTLSGGLMRDRYQYISGFGTADNLTENAAFSLSKGFVTGTALSLEFNYQFNNPTYASALAASFPTPYWEPKVALSLTQDLWQNAFGRAWRAGLEAGRKSSQAAQATYDDNMEGWFSDLVGVYYAAWLSKAQLRAASSAFERKERLVTLTKNRAASGSSDESDALQAETGRATALVQRNNSRQDLGDKWRGLVVSLKLPESWLAIDPAEIPMVLDDPKGLAAEGCAKSIPTRDPVSVTKARLMSEAAQLSLEKARSEYAPDLELGLSVGGNAQNTNSGSGLSEFFSVQHPRWAVTAKFKMPFEFSADRSRVQTASADAMRAEAAASQAAGQFRTDWLNACSNLKQLQESLTALQASFETQKRRLALDDRKFRLGRISLLSLLITDDDATATESAFNAAQVNTRLAAWRVLRLAGAYPEQIQKIREASSLVRF